MSCHLAFNFTGSGYKIIEQELAGRFQELHWSHIERSQEGEQVNLVLVTPANDSYIPIY